MSKLKQSHKEKLILGLVANDITQIFNTVCKVWGITFHIDYTSNCPVLALSRPGIEPQVLMTTYVRNKRCTLWVQTLQPDLLNAYQDLVSRLGKIEAHILLAVEKDANQRYVAKMQVHVQGARSMALTLLDARKGQRISDNTFEMYGENSDGQAN